MKLGEANGVRSDANRRVSKVDYYCTTWRLRLCGSDKCPWRPVLSGSVRPLPSACRRLKRHDITHATSLVFRSVCLTSALCSSGEKAAEQPFVILFFKCILFQHFHFSVYSVPVAVTENLFLAGGEIFRTKEQKQSKTHSNNSKNTKTNKQKKKKDEGRKKLNNLIMY